MSADNIPTISEEGEFYIIEFSSMCSKDRTTPLNHQAIRLHLKLRYFIGSLRRENQSIKIGFISFDVCNDTDLLVSSLSDVLLHGKLLKSKHDVSDDDDHDEGHCSIHHCLNHNTTIIAVISFMPHQMTTLAADILSMESIPYFAFAKRVTSLPATHHYFHPSYQLLYSDMEEMEDRILLHDFKYVALVIIGDINYNRLSSLHRQKFWESLIKDKTICVDKRDLDPNNTTELKLYLSRIKRDETLRVIIIWCKEKYRKLFLKLTKGIKNRVWYWYTDKIWTEFGQSNDEFHYETNPYYLENHIFINHPVYAYQYINNKYKYKDIKINVISDVYKHIVSDPWIAIYTKENIIDQNYSIVFAMFDNITSIADDHIEALLTPLWWSESSFNSDLNDLDDIQKRIQILTIPSVSKHVVNKTTNQIYLSYSNESVYSLLHELHEYDNLCKVPTCSPGYEPIKAVYFLEADDVRYNWKCIKCRNNYVQYYYGNKTCTPCEIAMKANMEKTECFDISVEVYLNFTDVNVTILLSCIIPLILLNIFVIFTFLKYNSTPVIRSRGSNSSIIQLCAHAMIYVEVFTCFIGKPRPVICFSQVFISGFLLTILLSMTFTKTQTLLFAFKAKCRLTKKEIFLSNTVKTFISILLVLMQCIISVVCVLKIDRHMEVVLDGNNRKINCLNKKQFHFQFLYIIMLSFVCSVQAFRARNLPSDFNDSKQIAFSMYINIVISCVRFPLAEIKSNDEQNILNAVVITLINTNQFLFGFITPVYVVLFQKEKNTKTHFRQAMKLTNRVYPGIDESMKRIRKITVAMVAT